MRRSRTSRKREHLKSAKAFSGVAVPIGNQHLHIWSAEAARSRRALRSAAGRRGGDVGHYLWRSCEELQRFVKIIPALPLPAETGEIYGTIRHNLQRRGAGIGPNDLWIAAHAIASGLTLVTNNE